MGVESEKPPKSASYSQALDKFARTMQKSSPRKRLWITRERRKEIIDNYLGPFLISFLASPIVVIISLLILFVILILVY